jgi:hypothetical protein
LCCSPAAEPGWLAHIRATRTPSAATEVGIGFVPLDNAFAVVVPTGQEWIS